MVWVLWTVKRVVAHPLSREGRLAFAWYTIGRMRRALFIALLALLIADASGVSSLVVPETCGFGTNESSPDNGCPAFCVRCSCACCASPVMPMLAVTIVTTLRPPVDLPLAAHGALPAGVPFDILHIPKSLLT
jgi:hypothetical protein